MISIVKALQTLRPGACWALDGETYNGLEWLDENQTKPTEKEINQEIERLQNEYDAKEYQRLRAPNYPPKEDFIDAYYWAQKGDTSKMDEYIQKCDDVKAMYPK